MRPWDSMPRDAPPALDLINAALFPKQPFARFRRPPAGWKVLSGKWEFQPPHQLKCRREPSGRTGENLAIIGSRGWDDLTFSVTFRLLSQSLKPPEGGAIVYFLFDNLKNFYSLHFCLSKHKVEFIKRFKGEWETREGREFCVELHKDYRLTVTTSRGIHRCGIEGWGVLTVNDADIPMGCVGIGAKYCDVEFSQASLSRPLGGRSIPETSTHG